MMHCTCTRDATGEMRCTKCGAALCQLCGTYAKAHGGAGPECQPGGVRPVEPATPAPIKQELRSHGPKGKSI